tara:strand:- start:103 stop:1098 length:996 start_codon:yes stop_codon:yes gene_type:complete
MVITRTPYRMSFFGGGTDYPAWFKDNGGAVLSATIDHYAYITLRGLPPFFDHRHRLVYSKVEEVTSVDAIQHPAVRAVLQTWWREDTPGEGGYEIHHDGDLPARSGTGSSSTFMVGLLNALATFQGQTMSKYALAKEAIRIERNIMGETVGSQDQFAVAYGGINHLLFHPDGEVTGRTLHIHPLKTERLECHLMLGYTGVQRVASSIAATYVQDLCKKEDILTRMQQMPEEGIALMDASDIQGFGALLDEAWQLKKQLGEGITTPEIDDIYDAAKAAGALGGKVSGAGGGGFMFFVVPDRVARGRITQALPNIVWVPVRFEETGTTVLLEK